MQGKMTGKTIGKKGREEKDQEVPKLKIGYALKYPMLKVRTL